MREPLEAYFTARQVPAQAVVKFAQELQEQKRFSVVIDLLECALLNDQAQPWMYEVLALAMELEGRPKADVERVLLSSVDFSTADVHSMLFAAAYMYRVGRAPRALHLYRQAAMIDPSRPEPYALGLKIARQARDVDATEWAITGILAHVWTRDHEKIHREAELAAAELEQQLIEANQHSRVEAFRDKLAEARQRDLVLELTWSGEGDLDLIVEEPLGTVCSFNNRSSRGGGVLVHDGAGPNQKNTFETYVCPQGAPGEYRITVRHMGGKIVAKQALLKITRYRGAPDEIVRTRTLDIGSADKVLRISLHRGRRTDLAPAVSWAGDLAPSPPKPQLALQYRVPAEAGAGAAATRFQITRPPTGGVPGIPGGSPAGFGAVGFQPIIRAIPEGVQLQTQAVISADRRYVRISAVPIFSAITDVFTFSFQQ